MANPDFTAAELRRGEMLFKGPCTFVKGVVAIDGLPNDGKPEIAFAGRSNVGKSSLINALTGQKSLARVSVTPGRTREVNFFTLGKDDAFYLVDMPGYGYARASKAEVKGWTRLIQGYLKGRRELKRVFLLIDARHGLKASDREIMQGHVAYPHLAKNPLRGLIALLARLYDQPLDFGSAYFSPSNFEVTSIDVGNPTTNVIPVKAEAMFNIRYNDRHSADSLQTKIRELAVKFLEPNGLDYELTFEPPSQAFLTEPGQLDSTLTQAVREVTGITPSLATDGGTSDARFIKEMCPVVEFGLLTATIHKIDEQVRLADLAQLTAVYRRFLDLYFEEFGIFELV